MTERHVGPALPERVRRLVDRTLPPDVIMFTIYARSCDPTLTFLRSTHSYSDEQVLEYLVRTCFAGLNG